MPAITCNRTYCKNKTLDPSGLCHVHVKGSGGGRSTDASPGPSVVPPVQGSSWSQAYRKHLHHKARVSDLEDQEISDLIAEVDKDPAGPREHKDDFRNILVSEAARRKATDMDFDYDRLSGFYQRVTKADGTYSLDRAITSPGVTAQREVRSIRDYVSEEMWRLSVSGRGVDRKLKEDERYMMSFLDARESDVREGKD